MRMSEAEARHWAHPQTIPRGFLRIFMLAMISKGAVTGYDIMQHIEEKTDGAWRPGPGTIYPLLKSLSKERLISSSRKGSKTSRVSYTITPSGEQELAGMRASMPGFGRKERVVMRLVSDLVPPETLIPLLLNRAREGSEFLRSKILQMPEPERISALKELGALAENQLDWVSLNLKQKPAPRAAQRPSR
jgi:DNA-binding PadR family transcriptional regulator